MKRKNMCAASVSGKYLSTLRTLTLNGRLRSVWPTRQDLPPDECPQCSHFDPETGMDDEILDLIRRFVQWNIRNNLPYTSIQDTTMYPDNVFPTIENLREFDDEITACRHCGNPDRWDDGRLKVVEHVLKKHLDMWLGMDE